MIPNKKAKPLSQNPNIYFRKGNNEFREPSV
jgi:hypothetical protein